MSTRNTMFALAALASLAGAALAPTSASALAGRHFGGHSGSHFGGHFGHGPVVSSHLRITQSPIIFKNGNYWRVRGWQSYRPYRFPNRWGSYRYWPRWSGYRYYPRYWSWNRFRFHRPLPIGGEARLGGGAAMAAAAPVMASASAPASRPGNCLTKQYAPDGTVVFQDLCTHEEGVGAPQGQPMPQGPAS